MPTLYPSFFALHGRKPVAHQDYDPDAFMNGDDADFFNGTGQYSDDVKEYVDTDPEPAPCGQEYKDWFDPKESYLPDY